MRRDHVYSICIRARCGWRQETISTSGPVSFVEYYCQKCGDWLVIRSDVRKTSDAATTAAAAAAATAAARKSTKKKEKKRAKKKKKKTKKIKKIVVKLTRLVIESSIHPSRVVHVIEKS